MTEIARQTIPDSGELGIEGRRIERSVVILLQSSPQFRKALYGGDEFRKKVIFDPSTEIAEEAIIFTSAGGKYALLSEGSFSPKDGTSSSKFCFARISTTSNEEHMKIDEGVIIEYLSEGSTVVGSVAFLSKDKRETDTRAVLEKSKKFIAHFLNQEAKTVSSARR